MDSRKGNEHNIQRIMFAAPRSGSGKTMITCGFLNLFRQMGLDVTSYKCGPDYIDPMFHRTVLGISGGNLDTFLSSKEMVRNILAGDDHDYAVLEGVMGIYDGLGGLSTEASCYEIASVTRTPIILIIDAHGMGRTILSIIKGILADDNEHLIKGIVLNRMSKTYYEKVEPLINENLIVSGYDIKLLGYVPVIKDMVIDSRHLGLLLPEEIEGLQKKLNQISEVIRESCRINDILEIMENAEDACSIDNDDIISDENQIGLHKSAEAPVSNQTGLHKNAEKLVRIAVARDEAFCFYYKENLELLEKYGAELVPFSPLRDVRLPNDINGIILGGGYPELKLKQLSSNKKMKESIQKALKNGIPSIAECGGFMYLHKHIIGEDGKAYPMVGAVDGVCVNNYKLVRFGYVQANIEACDLHDDKLIISMNGIRGHEFHYYDSTSNGDSVTLSKPNSDISYRGMHVGANHVWGFPHLYYAGRCDFAKEFVEVCREYRHSN